MINAGRDLSFTNANSNNNGKMYSFTWNSWNYLI
jgi:hypothetical protein